MSFSFGTSVRIQHKQSAMGFRTKVCIISNAQEYKFRPQYIWSDLRSRIIRQLSNSPQEYTLSVPLTIADIGCGDGNFTNQLVNDIIINRLNIKYVNKYLIDPFGNREDSIITLRDKEFGDAFPSNFCDIIICKFAAHFSEHFHHWLNQCCRILKPNGRLYILNMSSDLDFTEQWGPHPQKSLKLGFNCEVNDWQRTEGPLPELKGGHGATSRYIYGCTVKHHKFNERVVLRKEDWRKFIAVRGWSNLQSLTGKSIKETLQFVDEKYKNSPTVDLDLKWTLSVVSKGPRASKL